MQNKWLKIINNLKNNPRDLHTVPKTKKQPLWFYAYTNGEKIYVTNAKENTPSSKISSVRTLDFDSFEKIYPIHLRREEGENVSQEATATTRNQVYWYSIISFCLEEKEEEIVSVNGKNINSKPTGIITSKIKPDEKLLVTEDVINLLGHEFKYLESLSPERNKDGSIKLFYPQENYNNIKNLPLSKYGEGTFCKFSINAKEVPGVYIWVVDNDIIYIGETVNLRSRFNQGYGVIYPRNCYLGGQPTNCKMNKVALEYSNAGKEVKLYFYETPDYKAVEFYLLKNIKTKYNVKDNY